MKNKKIYVFHPMQQHSFKTALAVKEAGYLFEYWTSIYYLKDNLLYRILTLILRESDINRLKKRSNDELDPYVRTCSTWLGLYFVIMTRVFKSRIVSTRLQKRLSKSTGKKVAREAIKNEVDYIIAYDTWAHGLISELKKQQSSIKVIIDFSSLYSERIIDLIEEDVKNNNTAATKFDDIMGKYRSDYLGLYQFEIKEANYFFSPSSVVDRSLTEFGVDKKQIYRASYGTNFKPQIYIKKSYKEIVFIYIGRLSYAKGVHHLIGAFQNLGRDDFKLLLIGKDVDGFSELITSSNIDLIGAVPHDDIPKYLERSDVAVSASLFDGFSLSLLESASYNLPIICTSNNGVSDYIVDGINGYKVIENNTESLRKSILMVLNDKRNITNMSKEVGKIVNELSWENYNSKIETALLEIISNEYE